jgi:RNA ligase
MHYKFPTITNLDQVKTAIEGYDEFRVTNKGFYTVVNYAVAFDNTFDIVDENDINGMIRRECRGLIFDVDGNLISRPYHKFFNLNERKETHIDTVGFDLHTVLEKMDGSMIRPIPSEYGFRLATKAGITDVAINAEIFISDKPEYANFINHCISRNLTPIFEWCSRKNRIVVDYPEDKLVLTALRSIKNGSYCSYNNLRLLAEHYDIPLVKKWPDNMDIQQLVEYVRNLEDEEGIVLRFDNGHMLKIKAEEYVLRHKSKEQISQEKNVLEVIIEDKVDDVIPLLSDSDANRLKYFQKAFWINVDEVAFNLAEVYQKGKNYKDKKSFAVEFVQKLSPHLQPFMYAMNSGKGSKSLLIESIKKSTTSQTKIDQSRWMWGNLVW